MVTATIKASDICSFIRNESCHEIETLLSSKSVDCDQRISSNSKPLITLAVETGNAKIVELLCRYNCNVRVSDYIGVTPLHVAVSNGYTEIVKILLQYGANVESAYIYTHTTPIHLAAERIGNSDILKLLLSEYKNKYGELDCCDLQGQTPLMRSCIFGHGEKAGLLLSSGANPFLKDKIGNTAFSLAYNYPSVSGSFLELILQNIPKKDIKSVVNETDADGDRPIHILTKNRSSHKFSAIKTLLKYGADVNKTNWMGTSPLEMAIRKKDYEMIRVLILSGCSIEDKKPLEIAIERNQLKIIQLLLKCGYQIQKNSHLWNKCSDEVKDWLISTLKEPFTLAYHSRLSLTQYRRQNSIQNPLDMNKSLLIPRNLIPFLEFHE